MLPLLLDGNRIYFTLLGIYAVFWIYLANKSLNIFKRNKVSIQLTAFFLSLIFGSIVFCFINYKNKNFSDNKKITIILLSLVHFGLGFYLNPTVYFLENKGFDEFGFIITGSIFVFTMIFVTLNTIYNLFINDSDNQNFSQPKN